jgi:hypothetical protein
MLLVLLLRLGSSGVYYGFDLGSQFVKFGQVDNTTHDMTRLYWNGRDTIPSGIALKTKTKRFSHIPSDSFGDVEIMIGSTAVSYIHRNPKVGCEFPALSLTRDGTPFTTSRLMTPLEFMGMFAWQLLSHFPAPDGIALTVPSLLSAYQSTRLSNAFRLFNVPILDVYDDITVISTLYADMHIGRFIARREWHVLFVDAGAAYFKAYVQNFTVSVNGSESQTMGFEWSERASGNAIVRALANATQVPIAEAQRLVRDLGDGGDFARAELQEMRRVITSLLHVVGPIDEVQLFGGVAHLTFVHNMIQRITEDYYRPFNRTEDPVPQIVEARHVRRDFDSNHALLEGTLHMISRRENYTQGVPITITRKPLVSYYVEWGSQKEKYCQKNFNCRFPVFQFKPETTEISITADPRQIPPGSPVVVNKYKMKNISKIEYNETNPGRILMQLKFPEPIIEYLAYTNGTGLIPIDFVPMIVNQEEIDQSYSYFQEVLTEIHQLRMKLERIEVIRAAVEKMEAAYAPAALNQKNNEMYKQIMEQLEDYKQKVNDGTYQRMSMNTLKRVMQEIEAMASLLGFDVR